MSRRGLHPHERRRDENSCPGVSDGAQQGPRPQPKQLLEGVDPHPRGEAYSGEGTAKVRNPVHDMQKTLDSCVRRPRLTPGVRPHAPHWVRGARLSSPKAGTHNVRIQDDRNTDLPGGVVVSDSMQTLDGAREPGELVARE